MWRLLVPAALALAMVGCGSGTSTLSGKVTYQGRPVLSGYVTVVNEDGTASSGVIQPDGTYTVEGVKRGHVRIAIVSPDPARAHSVLNKGDHKDAKAGHGHTKPGTNGWYPLPANLGDPEKSGLTLDATASRVRHDIEMN